MLEAHSAARIEAPGPTGGEEEYSAAGGLRFSCLARGAGLYGRPNMEAAIFGKQFPGVRTQAIRAIVYPPGMCLTDCLRLQVPWAGLFCNGELHKQFPRSEEDDAAQAGGGVAAAEAAVDGGGGGGGSGPERDASLTFTSIFAVCRALQSE